MSLRLPSRIEHWRMDRLRLSPRNPRQHDEDQVARIAKSMQAFGWTNPLLVDPSGEIIAGEARFRAAQSLQLDIAPVIPLIGLTAQQRDAYRIADNRLAEYATWNEDLLSEVLADLESHGFDLDLTGFTESAIAEMLAKATGSYDPVADAAPPVPAEPISAAGELWQLGRHRLICGDSTKRETFARLLGGRSAQVAILDPPPLESETETADLVFTDPPYGMSYKGKVHGGILGDDARGSELVNLVASALQEARAASRPTSAFYVCLTWRTYGEFIAAMVAAGLRIAACIVWDKGSIGPGTLHYRPQHEFIFYCPSLAPGGIWNGGQGEADVWHLGRAPAGTYVHPTQKPVGLIERAIENSSRRGDIVLDCFGGSGSTLIAAERTGRSARLIELDPRFCDAIFRRYEDFTGDKAVRLG